MSTTNRFEAATDAELENFVNQQKSANTQKSTKVTISLLNQYKTQAFGNTQPFDIIERTELIKIMKSFYQKVKKSNGDPYEPGSLKTMHYGIIRYFRDEMHIELSNSENNDIVHHLGAVKK